MTLFHSRVGLGLQGHNKAQAKAQEQGLHLHSLCSQVPNKSLDRLRRLCWGPTQLPFILLSPGSQGTWQGGLTSPFLAIHHGQVFSGPNKMSSLLEVAREHSWLKG